MQRASNPFRNQGYMMRLANRQRRKRDQVGGARRRRRRRRGQMGGTTIQQMKKRFASGWRKTIGRWLKKTF